MEKEKNKNWIIILLAIICLILIALVVLFATGTISLDKNKPIENNNIETSNEQKNNTILGEQIFSVIIEEYKKAIKENNPDNNYTYVNENFIHHYFSQKDTEYKFDFKYIFYDINKDGIEEMIINNSNGIIDIFSYDGEKIIRLFEDNAHCLGERCSLTIYNDGTIYFTGSGGASHQYISFYNINKNTSTLNTINSYYLNYKEDGTVDIYDNETYDINNPGEKLNYSSRDELLTENIKNTDKIDLNTLNWITIN